jgi:oligosaccharide repeat unit polymerase
MRHASVQDQPDAHCRVQGYARQQSDLPFYCDPLKLFLLIWVVMLVSLSFHLTYVTYPSMGIPLLIFAVSIFSLLLGYSVSIAIMRRFSKPRESRSYAINIVRVRRINMALCMICLLIIAFNWITQGPPPAFGDLSAYMTYGRLKQILFPVLSTITVDGFLDTSKTRRSFYAAFGLSWLMIYVTRGIVLVTILQMFFVFSLRTSISKKRLYSVGLICLILAAFAGSASGNARTPISVFMEYLQIRPQYFDWPMIYLWLISYISIPFSNLCWVLDKIPFHGPTLSFLYPLLPSFWVPVDPHLAIHNDPRIIDGASTYLMGYALDFSYLGVFLANFCLGIGCAWLKKYGGPRKMLVSAIFLACLSFIFFDDFFSFLSTVIQIVIQIFVQRTCFTFEYPEDNKGIAA